MCSADKDHAEILARYFSRNRPSGLISAYLFGSYAAGRAHRESDVDVGVLLDRAAHPTSRMRFDQRVALSSQPISAFGTNDVDIVILNDCPPTLGARTDTTGRRVFCCDAALDKDFLRAVQFRAADFVPFLRRTRQIKLAALQR